MLAFLSINLGKKIGIIFDNPETATGGNALKFYASVRLDIRSVTSLKDSDGTISEKRTRVKIVKNKVAPPFRVDEFDIVYGDRISKFRELIDIGVELNIIKKSGSWFSYEDHKLAQGREASKDLLNDNLELFNKIVAVN